MLVVITSHEVAAADLAQFEAQRDLLQQEGVKVIVLTVGPPVKK
jgi:hypothetical protein